MSPRRNAESARAIIWRARSSEALASGPRSSDFFGRMRGSEPGRRRRVSTADPLTDGSGDPHQHRCGASWQRKHRTPRRDRAAADVPPHAAQRDRIAGRSKRVVEMHHDRRPAPCLPQFRPIACQRAVRLAPVQAQLRKAASPVGGNHRHHVAVAGVFQRGLAAGKRCGDPDRRRRHLAGKLPRQSPGVPGRAFEHRQLRFKPGVVVRHGAANSSAATTTRPRPADR